MTKLNFKRVGSPKFKIEPDFQNYPEVGIHIFCFSKLMSNVEVKEALLSVGFEESELEIRSEEDGVREEIAIATNVDFSNFREGLHNPIYFFPLVESFSSLNSLVSKLKNLPSVIEVEFLIY